MIKYFLLSICIFGLCNGDPIVNTSLGQVRGFSQISYGGKTFSSFEGIPFAKPPIGEKRFEAPEPAEPWDGVWNAKLTTECAQRNMISGDTISGDEDCLHINVYVPRETPIPSENLDVIVHIHGGSYMIGSGNLYCRPDFIMDHDVIFITFNYRVGILGFLSTEDDVVPGNNGMKDQVMALRWVQENIGSFGGNPDSVTITGLSAGASSVHLHYFSELSRGLFHKGFSQSDTAFNSLSIQEDASSKAKTLADAVGCPLTTTKTMVQCLKQRPYRQILEQLGLFYGYMGLPGAPFAPVVEQDSEAFLKDYPYNLLKAKEFSDVPWMASNTPNEGISPVLSFLGDLETINRNFDEWAPFLLDFNYTQSQELWDTTTSKIKQYYFGQDQDISMANLPKLIQLFSDRLYLVDAENAVRWQAAVAQSPVYYQWFNYPGDSNSSYVGHGDDAKYYFGNVYPSAIPLTDNELKMKDVVLEMLRSFAKTGKPEITGVNWEPTKGETLTYLNISSFDIDGIQLRHTDNLTPREFWKALGFLENDNVVGTKQ